MNQFEDEIRNQLAPKEKILWFGQSRKGLLLRGRDAFMIPFSFTWGGFAFFFEYSALNSNAPAFFVLWGIPFVLFGVYLIIGRFFVDAMQRSHTVYAITNERVLIASGIFTRKTRSINLNSLSDLSLSQGRGSEGTITFGADSSADSLSERSGRNAHLSPRFELIPDAKKVHDIIRSSQREAS